MPQSSAIQENATVASTTAATTSPATGATTSTVTASSHPLPVHNGVEKKEKAEAEADVEAITEEGADVVFAASRGIQRLSAVESYESDGKGCLFIMSLANVELTQFNPYVCPPVCVSA